MRLSNIVLMGLAVSTELTIGAPVQLDARGNAASTLSSPTADAIYTTVKNCAGITAVACGFAGEYPAMRIAGAVNVAASCAEGCVKWKRIYDQQQKEKEAKKKDAEKGPAPGPSPGSSRPSTPPPIIGGSTPNVGGVWNARTGKWEPARPVPQRSQTY